MNNSKRITLGLAAEAVPIAQSTRTLADANTWASYSFIAQETSLTSCSMPITTITGTPGSVGLSCEIQADTSGVPSNTALATSSALTGVTANARAAFTSFGSHTLTIGVRYHLVVKCTTAPTHYPIMMAISGSFNGGAIVRDSTAWAEGLLGTTTAGGAWSNIAVPGTGLVITYISGSISGDVILGTAATPDNAAGARIYGTQELGCEFVVPVDVMVVGVHCNIRKAAAYTDSVVCKIYKNRSLIATSLRIPAAVWTTTSTPQRFVFEFVPSIKLSTGDIIQVMICSPNATSSQGLYHYRIDYEDSVAGKAARPMFGTMKKALNANGAWTITETSVYPMAIVLDSVVPFPPKPLNRRKFNNQR